MHTSFYGIKKTTTSVSTITRRAKPGTGCGSHQGRGIATTDNSTHYLNSDLSQSGVLASTFIRAFARLVRPLNDRTCLYTLGTTIFLMLSNAATALEPIPEVPSAEPAEDKRWPVFVIAFITFAWMLMCCYNVPRILRLSSYPRDTPDMTESVAVRPMNSIRA